MRMEELSENRYIKGTDTVEKYLLNLVRDFFKQQDFQSPETSREYIIEKALERMKEEHSFEENKMETYGIAAEDNTNPFADISFKSAMNTFYQEDEEKEEIAA